MSELSKDIQQLQENIERAFDRLDIISKQTTLEEYEKEMALPEFWSDSDIAQEVSKKHAKLEKQLRPWLELAKNVQDLLELAGLDDKSMEKELQTQLTKAQKLYSSLEFELNFSGHYDSYDALITLQAGAGGTDAQDWAQMLQRMYSRWAESNDYKWSCWKSRPVKRPELNRRP